MDAHSLLAQTDFGWEVLDVILGGHSTIDSKEGFSIHTLEEAEHFIKFYGFDTQNPVRKAELVGHLREAIDFIKSEFLFPENPQGLKIPIPKIILAMEDPAEFLLLASNQTVKMDLKQWACSILKVMHTIAHIDQDLRAPYFLEVQKQILDRFYRVTFRNTENELFLAAQESASDRVDLVSFEVKPKKTRRSLLMKLLHKPENVAEDIFDRVGIRFITKTRVDALRVIEFLKNHMLVIPSNLKPSRSRNNLVNVEKIRHELPGLRNALSDRLITEAQYLERLDTAAGTPEINPSRHSEHANRHSGQNYRSIQFTCRQLISLSHPLFEDLRGLKALAKKLPDVPAPLAQAIERLSFSQYQKQSFFFYPFEVQVVDQVTHQKNEEGRSAHSEYKNAQRQTAMHRVMGTLARATG